MKIVWLLFLLFVSLTLGAQDITGKWYGYPDLKNMRLRLEYHVEKAGGGYQVTLKIPDLSEKTYRADAVELADHVLTVNIADAQTRSILRLQADGSLKGTFLWEGYDFELLLTRTPVVFKRPQTPKEPFSYHSEEVTFQNADDGVTLAGTLTWPASGARCKAVVLVSGSGGQDRNNTFSEHKTFFVLADYLVRHGIATLRVDDRGVGKSGGNLKESGLPDADADAVAAVNYLKQRPEINADSVGVIGHSEGAFVAFSMAARKEVPFIITLAGGGVSGSELLLMQRAALLKVSGVKEDFIEKYNNYMRQAQDIVLQSGDAATCERKLTELFNGTPLAGQAAATTQQFTALFISVNTIFLHNTPFDETTKIAKYSQKSHSNAFQLFSKHRNDLTPFKLFPRLILFQLIQPVDNLLQHCRSNGLFNIGILYGRTGNGRLEHVVQAWENNGLHLSVTIL